MKFTLAIVLCFSFNTSFCQLSPYEINGYAKYLFSTTKLPAASERYNDHLIHLRLNTRWYPIENLMGVMEMRLRGYYGESVENTKNFLDQIKGSYDFLDLEATIWEAKKSIGYGEIDRLYLDWNYENLELTAGRQRIAWGTSWTWNPTDIFNPLSVLNFDYEEGPAVDAIRVQYYTGAVSKIEFAFKPARNKENITAAGLLSLNIENYDLNFIGGIRKNKWLTGLSWVGDISGAGFRGEFLLNQGRKTLIAAENKFFGSNHPYYSFVLSGDYTFPSSFYIHTEVLHNSIGVQESASKYQQAAMDFGLITAAKWSLYQEFAYDFHPLVRGIIFGLFNPNDKSLVIVPYLTYSVITNLDFLLLVMFFDGDLLTEYGEYGSTIFARLKYSF